MPTLGIYEYVHQKIYIINGDLCQAMGVIMARWDLFANISRQKDMERFAQYPWGTVICMYMIVMWVLVMCRLHSLATSG